MKRALVAALVLTVLLTGVPVLMATSAPSCGDCALMVASSCVPAVLAALMVAFALLGVPLRSRLAVRGSLLVASGLERPPRLA